MPAVLASTSRVMVSEWVEGVPLSTAADLPAERAQRVALKYVRFLFAGPEPGRPAARRPASGQLQDHARRPARRGRLRSGGPAARRAALGDGPDPADRAARATRDEVRRAAACGGFRGLRRRRRGPAGLPGAVRRAGRRCRSSSSTGSGCASSSCGSRIPAPPAGSGMKLNLPPSYLLIHRVWTGGLAVLSQLERPGRVRRGAGGVPARLRPRTRRASANSATARRASEER